MIINPLALTITVFIMAVVLISLVYSLIALLKTRHELNMMRYDYAVTLENYQQTYNELMDLLENGNINKS